MKQKSINAYNHNYIGNIYVMIKNGFEITDIMFKNAQTVFDVFNLDEETFETISNDWSSYTYVETFGKGRIKLYFDHE
jgi:hypothetical protein